MSDDPKYKLTNKKPVRNSNQLTEKKFEWAKNRKWSNEAQRKKFRYPDDTEPPAS